MVEQNSQELRRAEARSLVSQLGMFAEENDIPKDLWDALEAEIYKFYEIDSDR